LLQRFTLRIRSSRLPLLQRSSYLLTHQPRWPQYQLYWLDDVYSDYFFHTIILHSASPTPIPSETIDYLFLQGAQSIILCGDITTSVSHLSLFTTATKVVSSPGPYLAVQSSDQITLHPIYRLEVDRYRTFVSGIYPSGDNYEVLGRVSKKFGDVLVPIPSRLYTLYSGKPLAGLRMAVKGEFTK
jgi:hypothetical protein